MILDMEDFRTLVGKLANNRKSASTKVDNHPKLDRPHAIEFGYYLEDRGLVKEADTVLDLSIKKFDALLKQLPS